jgi:tRNA-2-methylthio-N6-dimethylallyladenosine synthase
VAEAGYDSAYTFIYSPRTGTEAAERRELFVAPDVIASRFERLRVVVERSALARHEARVGRVEEILVEGRSKRDASMVTGRTAHNKLLHVPAPAGGLAAGSWAEVRVIRAAPHFLVGELLSVTARPRHRTRIPVAAL